jgi:rubrerythrin
MKTIEHDALQALHTALTLEQDGRRFYSSAAERTSEPKGKAMFRALADDEVLHAKVIQGQIDSLTRQGGWVLPEGIGEAAADLDTPLFPEGTAAFQDAVRSDASDMDALLFALKLENDSFDLYVEQAKAVQDPNARRVYEYLADAERTHFDLLMLNYESLSTAGIWAE